MAPLKFLVVAVVAGVATAFSPSTSGARTSTKLYENFGLGGASLDSYDAQPDLLKGEGQPSNRSRSNVSRWPVCLKIFLPREGSFRTTGTNPISLHA